MSLIKASLAAFDSKCDGSLLFKMDQFPFSHTRSGVLPDVCISACIASSISDFVFQNLTLAGEVTEGARPGDKAGPDAGLVIRKLPFNF